jgi:prepilin-type N-terminal cleavage/methylation domain-containing protein
MKNLHKKAFSLIEISVVILIIGMLIAGISQGIDLYQDSRLATARALTKSSRVGRIPDLVSWFETTAENIFSSGTTTFQNIEKVQADQKINRWKDSNPNSIYKYDATQTTDANQPKIIFDKDSSLPIVRFDGNPRYLALPDGTVPFGNSEYTVIFISKYDPTCFDRCGVLGSGNYGTNNQTNAFRYTISSAKNIYNYWWWVDIASPENAISPNKFQIFVFDYNKATRNIYINGANVKSISSSGRESAKTNNTMGLTCLTGCPGGQEYLVGAIAELIIYDRALLNSERKDIEKYLSKKWAIKIN